MCDDWISNFVCEPSHDPGVAPCCPLTADDDNSPSWRQLQNLADNLSLPQESAERVLSSDRRRVTIGAANSGMMREHTRVVWWLTMMKCCGPKT